MNIDARLIRLGELLGAEVDDLERVVGALLDERKAKASGCLPDCVKHTTSELEQLQAQVEDLQKLNDNLEEEVANIAARQLQAEAQRDELRERLKRASWRVVQCEGLIPLTEAELAEARQRPDYRGAKHRYGPLDQYNVVRNWKPPFEHYGTGGFTRAQADEHAARLNALEAAS